MAEPLREKIEHLIQDVLAVRAQIQGDAMLPLFVERHLGYAVSNLIKAKQRIPR